MKKILALLLALCMSFALCACGARSETPAEESPAQATAAQEEQQAPEAAASVDTCILYEEDESMLNTYTLIAVSPEAPFTDADGNPVGDVAVNAAGAEALVRWLLSPEALELAKMGILPEGMYRNRNFAEAWVDMGDTPLYKQDVLFDPQTAGGLLMAVDPADADELLAELKGCVPSAQRIGVVEDYQGGSRIFLR